MIDPGHLDDMVDMVYEERQRRLRLPGMREPVPAQKDLPLGRLSRVEEKRPLKLTLTSPSVSATARSMSSSRLRTWSATARALEWEAMTGASATAITSQLDARSPEKISPEAVPVPL